MWGDLLLGFMKGLLAVIKGLFGVDAPKKDTIDEKPTPLEKVSARQAMRDLGIVPADGGGVQYRTDDRDALCDRPSRAANPDTSTDYRDG